MDPGCARRSSWRRGCRSPGWPVLSAGDGGPLTRTVKKIIDPLVVRTAARPRLGRPVLEPAAAAELTGLLLADAARLRATAAWFPHLKRQRRVLRITAGDVQDVCFPLAYGLATGFGMPGPDAPETAASALRELHGEGEEAGVARLVAYLADPRVAADLTAKLQQRWHDNAGAGLAPRDAVALLGEFVGQVSDAAWRALADSAVGHALGFALRRPEGTAALAEAVPGLSDLGLQRGDRTTVPPLQRRDEAGPELLERSVERRVRATLRRLPAAERVGR